VEHYRQYITLSVELKVETFTKTFICLGILCYLWMYNS